MHIVVSPSSAMQMFDVLKNVMSSSEFKKKMNIRAEQFRFCGFTQMKLGDDCINTHSYLTHTSICGANCVLHRTVCRWTEGFIAGKVSFKDGPCLGRPASARTSKLYGVKHSWIHTEMCVCVLSRHGFSCSFLPVSSV